MFIYIIFRSFGVIWDGFLDDFAGRGGGGRFGNTFGFGSSTGLSGKFGFRGDRLRSGAGCANIYLR